MMNIRNTSQIPFDYLVSVSLTSGLQLTTTLTLQSDSWFSVVSLHGSTNVDSSRSDGAAVTNPFSPNNFSVLINDQSTGRNLSNARIPQRIMGPFQGYRLLEPILFPPSAILQFDFLDLSATTQTTTLVLRGYKIFSA